MNRQAMGVTAAGVSIDPVVDRRILDARILIADDEPLCCRLLGAILSKKNFSNYRFAESGMSALQQIESYRPDLVLLDMQMPDIDGLEVCRRTRANPEFADLPILVQTATVDRNEMEILFEAGASDFLSKPINPSELVSRVTVHLERRNLVRELRAYRQRMSQELDSARTMQFDLLPARSIQQQIVAAAGMRIGSYSRSSSEIGGDLWGMLPIGSSSFGIFLADFSGHGVTAALNTFRLHALIHEHADVHGDPVRFVEMLNERLVRVLPPGQFATFLYVVVDPSADRIQFVSAGAPPSIVTHGLDGGAVLVEASGLPLGVIPGAAYQLHERSFGPGSMLLLFSDGLSEFPDDRGSRIGDDGLRSAVGACHPGLTPSQVIDRLCEAAGIGEGDTLPDDTTVVCLDRRTESAIQACGHG
jgi:sigma-B regulation protein RsbU (phosphoserine phosphatase)